MKDKSRREEKKVLILLDKNFQKPIGRRNSKQARTFGFLVLHTKPRVIYSKGSGKKVKSGSKNSRVISSVALGPS